MLWAALAAAIMALSGAGDDSSAILMLFEQLRDRMHQAIGDAGRREMADSALDVAHETFIRHRKRLAEIGVCMRKVDATYSATPQDYASCSVGLDEHYESIAESLEKAHEQLQNSFTDDEWEDFVGFMNEETKLSRVVDRSVEKVEKTAQTVSDFRRLPGIEGVYTQRHITPPQNVLQVMAGPLSARTFGQRFSFGSVEAGFGHNHGSQNRSLGADGQNSWLMRAGIGFGLFPGFEAGALFIPLQFSPEVEPLQILVFFTGQFRITDDLDLAVRVDFTSPDDDAIPFLLGGSLRYRKNRTMLDVGLLSPMTLYRGFDADFGFHVPVRGSVNITPSLFTILETGYFYGDFTVPETQSISFGTGLGWTTVFGKRVVDLTARVFWDDFVRPASPAEEQFGGSGWQVMFGANLLNSVMDY